VEKSGDVINCNNVYAVQPTMMGYVQN